MGVLLGQRSFSRLSASIGPFVTNSVLVEQTAVAVVAAAVVAIIKASFREGNCSLNCPGIHMDEFLNFRVGCYQSCSYCISDSIESSSDAYDEHCFHLHYWAEVRVNCLLFEKAYSS